MPKIKLVKSKTNEMSGTGGSASATPGTGAQYASPKAFPKVASDYNKTFGTHFAPSIPNRPSKAITYKKLFEDESNGFKSGKEFINIKLKKYPKALAKINQLIDMIGEDKFTMDIAKWIFDFFNNASFESPIQEAGEYDSLAGILKQLGAEEDAVKVLIKAVEMGALKPSDAVMITKKALGMKESTDDADFDSDTTGAEGLQSSNPLEPSTLKEARYSEFKQMTKVRTPGEQLHRAIREIRRKIDEINKLVSYTEKMKTEMKEDVNEVNYLKRTKEALAKISARIQETNNKIKRLVQ